MVKTIAITNQKGGVGKTTTAVNLAASLAALRRRVLLVDLDPQGNASMGCGIQPQSASMEGVLLQSIPMISAIVHLPYGFSILPADQRLASVEAQLMTQEDHEHILERLLLSVQDRYDYILIDCPPATNLLTMNALVAADSVLIPVQCEYYALEGLAGLLKTIHHCRHTANPRLVIEGLLRTMYDGRNRLTLEVSDQLLNHFEDRVYHTVIPRNVRLAEAPSHGRPARQYDASAQGAKAYLALAAELIQKQVSDQVLQMELQHE